MTIQLADPVEILPGCRLWLARSDGLVEGLSAINECELTRAKFSDRDLSRWQHFRAAVKKRQFLNSRLAMRAVLQREFGDEAENIAYESDSNGCPFLSSSKQFRTPHISLSHSENAVAVAISDGEYPVGVDIEVSNPIHTNALRFVALHPNEQVWCDSHAGLESEALTTLWTIKESVWKTLREIRSIPFCDISVLFNGGRPKPVISNCHRETLQFRTQVFVQDMAAIVPESFCLSVNSVELRGCVTQRISL